jgi:ABC-type Co2+ transport system permease subunit
VVLRGIFYLSFIAISGFGAIGFYQLYKKLEKRKKIVAFIGYAAFITAIFVVMPQNPDEVTAPMELVYGFRAMSVIAVSTYWISLGVILGIFWQKIQPDKPIPLRPS